MSKKYDFATYDVQVVEVYVPKRLAYLSSLFEWLKGELEHRSGESLFKGFSLYEVYGVFRESKKKLHDEQTLVVRLIFDLPNKIGMRERERMAQVARAREISEAIVSFTQPNEKEVWLIQSDARKFAQIRRN